MNVSGVRPIYQLILIIYILYIYIIFSNLSKIISRFGTYIKIWEPVCKQDFENYKIY